MGFNSAFKGLNRRVRTCRLRVTVKLFKQQCVKTFGAVQAIPRILNLDPTWWLVESFKIRPPNPLHPLVWLYRFGQDSRFYWQSNAGLVTHAAKCRLNSLN